ncbi:hypothetical protein [Devosia sp. Naph2]|uniref:hypothetical protein n=1 Tax=Devosia polycyclovorans TaxID=3345148 RepID=UPI0035CECA12
MAAEDDVNRELREFKRYTGDGLPGEPSNAPLPVGDPSSGVHNPKKSGLRAMLLSVLNRAQQILDDAVAMIVPDDGVSTIKIQDGAVTEPKLAAGAATLAKIGDDAKADFRLVDPNGPRDTGVWAAAQDFLVEGTSWAMGGFRRKGKYVLDRARVFPSAAFQNYMNMTDDLSHGMTSPTTENWYGAFAVANDGDANASFELSPFLRARSVAGGVITLGKCGELADALGTLPAATYSWADDALVGTEVLVITEMFSAQSWTMRVATVTANTATTITLDTIGNVAAGSLLLLAPSGWDYYRYCTSFYYDTAEIRNMFDGGGGPVRCRMAGTNVVYAHGNDGSNSTYLDGPVATAAKKLTFTGFVSPLATGIYIQSSFLLGSSSTGLRAQLYYDMDGGIHTPELHDFVKDGADQVSPTESFFLTFKGDQFCFPSTGGASQALIARVNINVSGWWEP